MCRFTVDFLLLMLHFCDAIIEACRQGRAGQGRRNGACIRLCPPQFL
jgi:hypothetical protein